MGRIVYSSPSIESPGEGDTSSIQSVPTERSERPEPRVSERRISLQDYAFTFMLADAAALVGTEVLLNQIYPPKAQTSTGWVSPYLFIICLFYLLASITFKSYSSSIVLNYREMARRSFSALGVSFGLFLIPGGICNIAYDYSRPRFFFGLSVVL
jgi:hypothetical protein